MLALVVGVGRAHDREKMYNNIEHHDIGVKCCIEYGKQSCSRGQNTAADFFLESDSAVIACLELTLAFQSYDTHSADILWGLANTSRGFVGTSLIYAKDTENAD